MIFFKDYLREETNPSATPSASFLEDNADKIVDFPTYDTSQECSREEIGKWVDKLMAMPDEVGDLHRPSASADDPFLAVASRIFERNLTRRAYLRVLKIKKLAGSRFQFVPPLIFGPRPRFRRSTLGCSVGGDRERWVAVGLWKTRVRDLTRTDSSNDIQG